MKAGDWYWNGRHLSLEWWSLEAGSTLAKNEAGQKWIKAFGVPLHGWTMNTFRYIGNLCGGFVGIDEDTKHGFNLFWARICVHSKGIDLPKEMTLVVDNLKFKISIVEDQLTKIIQEEDRNIGVKERMKEPIVEMGRKTAVRKQKETLMEASSSFSKMTGEEPMGNSTMLRH